MMENNQPRKSYYSITPANVRYSKKLVDGAKLLYGEITALCNERGYCWATNDYFAQLYGNDVRTVSRWLTSLVKEDHIYIDNTKGIRKIFLSKSFNADDLYDEVDPDDGDKPLRASRHAKASKPKREKKAVVPKFTDNDLFLAELLLQKIIYNFPAFENKKVKINEWADDIRMLREIDKATPEQITFMIMWLQGGEYTPAGKPTRKMSPHEFWSKNILSAGKLRKQWFTLVPQLQEEIKKTVKKSTVTQL